MCGALRWLEQCTRPDISATLSELCKVQSNPGEVHLRALERLMRYAVTTKHYGILYGGPKTSASDGPCVGYVDSDWGGDPDTSHSRGGYIFTAWQAPISWASFKMRSVAASSCESEYMAAAHATRHAVWLRYLYSDMGYGDLSPTTFGKLCADDYKKKRLGDVRRGEKPTMILIDNKGALALTENPVMHKRSKHIHISYAVSKQHVAKKHVRFNYINTKENLADIMTKVTTKSTHDYLVGHLLHELRDDGVHRHRGEPVWPWEMRAFVEHEAQVQRRISEAKEAPHRKKHNRLHPGLLRTLGATTRTDRQVLYRQEPAGLLHEDLLTPAFADGVAASVRDGSLELSKVVSALRARHPRVSGAAWAMRATLARQLRNAIIDSGASFTYVTKDVDLDDPIPGNSYVWVANGQREKVAEEGKVGPIANAKKVESFSRSLISVADLVDQYGGVYFDPGGAHVISSKDGKVVITSIGNLTRSRLYALDLPGLVRHAEEVGGSSSSV